jgi:hypothetical protein
MLQLVVPEPAIEYRPAKVHNHGFMRDELARPQTSFWAFFISTP